MKKAQIIFSKTNLIAILLVLVFLFEFTNTFLLYFTDIDKSRLSGYYKIFLLTSLISTISFHKIPRLQLFLFLVLTVFFVINQNFLNPILKDTWHTQIKSGSYYYVSRLLFIFIFIFASKNWQQKDLIFNRTLTLIEWILIINSILIVIGALFNVNLFKTYSNTLRFGWDGMFNRHNQVSMLYNVYLVFLYYKLIHKQTKLVYFLLIVLASILIGTKVILLFLGLLLLFHLMYVSQKFKPFRFWVLIPLIVSSIFYKSIFKLYFSLFPFWKNLDSKYSLVSKIFSTRDLVLIQNYDYLISKWSFINYLIGGGWYSKNFRFIEMDLFALIVVFGFVGAAIYLYLFLINFFKKTCYLQNGLFILLIICGFLAGSFFACVSVMMFMYIVSHSFNKIKS